jgi:hypothetical protein
MRRPRLHQGAKSEPRLGSPQLIASVASSDYSLAGRGNSIVIDQGGIDHLSPKWRPGKLAQIRSLSPSTLTSRKGYARPFRECGDMGGMWSFLRRNNRLRSSGTSPIDVYEASGTSPIDS